MNVYYNPDEFGLKIVDELDDPHADYSFDYLVVWKHDDGRVFWATDSGCSCPSPFEDYSTLEDLTLVTNSTWREFQDAVENHCLYEGDSLAADRTQLLGKVSKLVPRD